MNLKEEIGRRIRQAREAKGWTLEELAARTAGLKPARISNYEQGLRTPKPQDAKQLAKALEISAAFILCVDEESELKPDEKALLDNYRATDRRGKDTIIRLAQAQPANSLDRTASQK